MTQTTWERLYPDLFDPLDNATRRAVTQTLTSHQLDESPPPNHQSIADLIAYLTGEITEDEYDRRSAQWAVDSHAGG